VSVAEQPAGLPEPEVPPADLALVAAVLRKDRKATADFVARYADTVHRYIRARVFPRQGKAEDLFQEVFIAAWQNLGQFRGDSSLESWLMGIARHKVEDFYRAQLREAATLDEEDTTLGVEGEFQIIEGLDEAKQRAKMKTVLAGLPEIYRLVLMWRYWEKRTTREMADQCGKTEKSIERLLARARQQFREVWMKA
jgi:RNA polymerase sigma-70 factor (ECF subfamily)